MTLDPAKAADLAIRAIPPAWPLAATVAVNPFLGQVEEDLAAVAARLSRVAGTPVTLPRPWYQGQIDQGYITDKDLAEALSRMSVLNPPGDLEALKAAAQAHPPEVQSLPTVADLAAEASGIDWPGVIEERFGAWAAGYFDEGQALWAAPRGRGAYLAWKAVATHDLTPEILGLPGFATHVSEAPERALEVVSRVAERLGLSPEALETYFHQLLTTLGGWGQAARRLHWQAELEGGTDETALDFLAIRLTWEWALADAYWPQIEALWRKAAQVHAQPLMPTADQVVDATLQAASEIAQQRALAKMLAQPPDAPPSGRPALQAAFCIDVRSEVFRRALESVGPDIQTLGFAGFFGLASSHRGFASDVAEHRAPVLLKPSLLTCSGGPEDQDADQSERFAARASRAWGRFKLAAVSSFAFVEATGPLYGAKLLGDALRLHGRNHGAEPKPRFDPALDLEARTGMAGTVLKAMSLTTGFAEVIILAGHGAQVTNNPFASSLHCGACGGYSGEVNARLLASLLNDPEVRSGLLNQGIDIPTDTLFVGALHDTTGDQVTLFDQDLASIDSRLDRVRAALASAGALARAERALRLPGSHGGGDIARRSKDWAEVRPEWGLAGCQAFIAAPRSRTQGKSLQGRAFLHDYDWRQDDGFCVLELILTAPVVVASWISLQYYGSTVAPALFGAGDKLLHNVVGGMGVVEGNGGALRTGLPWQSVHDGEAYVHEPLRLSVLIEAPTAEISEVLHRHPGVRALFDNGWLHLFGLNDQGHMAWRYCGGLQWQAYEEGLVGSQS